MIESPYAVNLGESGCLWGSCFPYMPKGGDGLLPWTSTELGSGGIWQNRSAHALREGSPAAHPKLISGLLLMAVRRMDPHGNWVSEGMKKSLPRGDLREGLEKQSSAPCWIVSGSRTNCAVSQCDLEGGKARSKLKLSLASWCLPSQEKAVWASVVAQKRRSCLPVLCRGSRVVAICQHGPRMALPDAGVLWNCSRSTGHRG